MVIYAVAKILDEPKKLESLILSILKILITAWIGTEILGFEFSPIDISLDVIKSGGGEMDGVKSSSDDTQGITFDELIYLVLTVVGLWYLIWTVIADLLIGGLIRFLATKGKPENILRWVLNFFGVISIDKDGRIKGIKKKIVWFVDMINSEDFEEETLDVEETRINQYFYVGLFGFLILWYSNDVILSGWEFTIVCIVLPSIFLSSIFIQRCFNYLNDSLPEVRREYNPFAHTFKVRRAITSNKLLRDNFEIAIKRKKICLTLKKDYVDLPKQIVIVPAYCSNEKIGLDVFKDISAWENNKPEHTVLVTGILDDEKLEQFKSERFEVVSGESEEEIYQAIENYLFRKRKEVQKAKKVLEDIE